MNDTKVKKFYPFKGPNSELPIYYRPGTTDEAILEAMFGKNPEYWFPIDTKDFEVIFDIGAHIGVVTSILAHLYPDSVIHSFEPDAENFKILKLNSAPYKNVKIHNCALGKDTARVNLFESDDATNFGGKSLHIKTEVPPTLVDMRCASEVCREFGYPDLIKIDTEGAEWDILSNIINLEKVKYLAGELHGIADFAVLDLLDSQGFDIRTAREFGAKVFHFHAANKSWTKRWSDQTLQKQNSP